MEYGGSRKITGVEFLSRNWLVEVLQLVAVAETPCLAGYLAENSQELEVGCRGCRRCLAVDERLSRLVVVLRRMLKASLMLKAA